VSLPKVSLDGFDSSLTPPEASLDMSEEGTGLTLKEDSARIPANFQF